MTYAIFKDYGYITEKLVASGIKNLDDAIERAKELAWVSECNDLIEVASFTDDGEYLTHYSAFGRHEVEERLYDEF